MNNKEPGYVYILTNPSFREDWVKIGKSSRPVDVRSKEFIEVDQRHSTMPLHFAKNRPHFFLFSTPSPHQLFVNQFINAKRGTRAHFFIVLAR